MVKSILLKRLAPVLFWLLVWQTASLLIGKELLLPSPLRVFARLGSMITQGTYWKTVLYSVLRTAEAYLTGITAGCLLAMLCRLNTWADRLIRPALTVIRATPVASFIILLLVWLSSSGVPAAAGMLMVIPVVFVSVREGLENVDRNLIEMAECFRFGKLRIWTRIMLPSVFPAFIAACETCVGLCFKATIAAEVIGVPRNAIGSMLHSAKVYLETDTLLAWTVTVILLSMIFEKLLKGLLERSLKHVHHA